MEINFDEELYRMKALILQALAHPIRLKIIDSISEGEKCVCDIVNAVGSERSNVSKHISILLKADLLTSEKKGLNIFYKLKLPCVEQLISCIEDVIREQIELRNAVLANNSTNNNV